MVGIFGLSHIESSRWFRCELVHDFIPPNACAVSGICVVEFMLSSFPLLYFEDWSVVESGVDAKLFLGRLMAATTAAPRRIILRRDKQLDPSLESGDIPDSASSVCVGMFIAISSIAFGR